MKQTIVATLYTDLSQLSYTYTIYLNLLVVKENRSLHTISQDSIASHSTYESNAEWIAINLFFTKVANTTITAIGVEGGNLT